jgi:CheY-like chemotaxis protein
LPTILSLHKFMPERLTILLVDDENALLRLCLRVLENVGYNVLSEYSGESVPLILEQSVPPNSGWI